MKLHKLYTNILFVAGILLSVGSLSSCEDYLTILPSDKIPEEHFWKERSDLEAVRAGAYQQLAAASQTERILVWGEVRADNLTLNNVSNSNINLLQTGVLQPSVGLYDWSGFYKGINYCNLVLEQGDKMTTPGSEIDPSFTRRDWRPIRAEMLALRSLYYFYLVRAYRNVPFVTKSVRSDAEATANYPSCVAGEAILGELIDSLEANIKYAAVNYGSDYQNKVHFTRNGVRALLADLYLWRGCMLKEFDKKKKTHVNLGYVNFTDVAYNSTTPGGSDDENGSAGNEGDDNQEGGDEVDNGEESTTSSPARANSADEDTSDEVTENVRNYTTKDGVAVNGAYAEALAAECFAKSEEYADLVIQSIKQEYDKDIADNLNASQEEKDQIYPLYQCYDMKAPYEDVAYNNNFGYQLSRESIFELDYDGVTAQNTTVTSYLSGYNNGWQLKTMALNSQLVNSATSVDPTVGFGKTDMRLWETCEYTASSVSKPLTKFIVRYISYPDKYNMVERETAPDLSAMREDQVDVHWPIYRLTDVMLIKAEAIARGGGETAEAEGFRLVNHIFLRNNPALVEPENTDPSIEAEYRSTRFNDPYDGEVTLLSALYRERQREFIGEGKRWFDIVRQAEFTNDAKTTLSTFVSLKSTTIQRLSQMWALYLPIYSEEIKVNSNLKQNPVWDRYTKK